MEIFFEVRPGTWGLDTCGRGSVSSDGIPVDHPNRLRRIAAERGASVFASRAHRRAGGMNTV